MVSDVHNFGSATDLVRKNSTLIASYIQFICAKCVVHFLKDRSNGPLQFQTEVTSEIGFRSGKTEATTEFEKMPESVTESTRLWSTRLMCGNRLGKFGKDWPSLQNLFVSIDPGCFCSSASHHAVVDLRFKRLLWFLGSSEHQTMWLGLESAMGPPEQLQSPSFAYLRSGSYLCLQQTPGGWVSHLHKRWLISLHASKDVRTTMDNLHKLIAYAHATDTTLSYAQMYWHRSLTRVLATHLLDNWNSHHWDRVCTRQPALYKNIARALLLVQVTISSFTARLKWAWVIRQEGRRALTKTLVEQAGKGASSITWVMLMWTSRCQACLFAPDDTTFCQNEEKRACAGLERGKGWENMSNPCESHWVWTGAIMSYP